ncbi:MAG: energy transducer TonB [Prolixibacteraceae bacterium]|nr:energy transducer TonB [Prolixibacteraceae bacterium]MBN2773159.1 energy transducer TonB [Prolixibacteraceae bacterium]
MEPKKSKKADLENKRNTFLLIGLVVALGATLLAFEWTSKPSAASSLGELTMQEVEEEFIPVTREQEVKPPPPPKPTVVEILTIVDDDVELDEELDIESTEADDETIINIAPIIQAEEEEEVEEQKIFTIVEQQPEFPGGARALYAYINDHVKYPVMAQENGIQGRVFVKFVVDTDGSVSNVEVTRSVDKSLDQEALRVIKSLPKFRPGMQRGNPVRVFFNASINFTLQ